MLVVKIICVITINYKILYMVYKDLYGKDLYVMLVVKIYM